MQVDLTKEEAVTLVSAVGPFVVELLHHGYLPEGSLLLTKTSRSLKAAANFSGCVEKQRTVRDQMTVSTTRLVSALEKLSRLFDDCNPQP